MKKLLTLLFACVVLHAFAQSEYADWRAVTSNEDLLGYQLFGFHYPGSAHFEQAVQKIDSLQQLSEEDLAPCKSPSCMHVLLNAQGYAMVGFGFKKHDDILKDFREMLYNGEPEAITPEVAFKTPMKKRSISQPRIYIELPAHTALSADLYRGLVRELRDYRDNICQTLFDLPYVELVSEDQHHIDVWCAQRITLIHQASMFDLSE